MSHWLQQLKGPIKINQNLFAITYYYPKNQYLELHNNDYFSPKLLGCKYNIIDYSDILAHIMADFLKRSNIMNYIDVIVHAPHSKSRNWQPNNLIAEKLSKTINKPYYNALIKTEISSSEIIINPACEQYIKDKVVLLFDDVYTRGNTFRTSRLVLENNGAKNIIGVIFGRTYSESFIVSDKKITYNDIVLEISRFFNNNNREKISNLSLKPKIKEDNINVFNIYKLIHIINDINKLETILKKGFNLNYKDNSGMTILHKAILQGNSEKVRLLLEYNAAPDTRNIKGLTPLMIAADKGFYEIVKILVDNGADIEYRDHNGETALDKAKLAGHSQIINLLKKSI